MKHVVLNLREAGLWVSIPYLFLTEPQKKLVHGNSLLAIATNIFSKPTNDTLVWKLGIGRFVACLRFSPGALVLDLAASAVLWSSWSSFLQIFSLISPLAHSQAHMCSSVISEKQKGQAIWLADQTCWVQHESTNSYHKVRMCVNHSPADNMKPWQP